jgi:hypothetical protein
MKESELPSFEKLNNTIKELKSLKTELLNIKQISQECKMSQEDINELDIQINKADYAIEKCEYYKMIKKLNNIQREVDSSKHFEVIRDPGVCTIYNV